MGPWYDGAEANRGTEGLLSALSFGSGVSGTRTPFAREVGPNPPLGARRRCEAEKWRARVIARWAGLIIHLIAAGPDHETAQPSRCRPTFRLYLAIHMRDRQANRQSTRGMPGLRKREVPGDLIT